MTEHAAFARRGYDSSGWRRAWSWVQCILLVAVGLALSGCAAPLAAEGPPAPPTPAVTTNHPVGGPVGDAARAHARGTSLAQLAALPVKGRAPLTGYSREQFGQAWLDADRNGCDTRNDILDRFLDNVVHEPGTGDCVVLTGDITDLYTGRPIRFVRGSGESLDIDHVVALGDAWQTGAYAWAIGKRAALANDPLNLLPVDYSANRQKGDADAASWLPPNKRYRCAYVARQVAVKAKYGLWVTPPERAAIARILARCPGQPATPDPTHAPTLVPFAVAVPVPTTAAAQDSGAGAGGSRQDATGSCEPGYSPCLPVTADLDCADVPTDMRPVTVTGSDPYRLDGDGDGLACE